MSADAEPWVIELRTDRWSVAVLPDAAASLAWVRTLIDGQWRDVLRPTDPARFFWPTDCSSFPLIPWSNRVVGGQLTFRDRVWRLPITGDDGTTLHGAVLPFGFDVTESSPSSVTLSFDSRTAVGVGFPWEFRAEVGYVLSDDGLTVTTSVTNLDCEEFPAGLGHHPFFKRELVPGCGQPQLEISATHGYELSRAVAVGPPGAVPQRADFRQLRAVGTDFVDDCLTGLGDGPIRIVYPKARRDGGDVEVSLVVDPLFSHLVVYVPEQRSYFALEPVTHANGGFALAERGVAGSGVFILAPGESRRGSFTISVA